MLITILRSSFTISLLLPQGEPKTAELQKFDDLNDFCCTDASRHANYDYDVSFSKNVSITPGGGGKTAELQKFGDLNEFC